MSPIPNLNGTPSFSKGIEAPKSTLPGSFAGGQRSPSVDFIITPGPLAVGELDAIAKRLSCFRRGLLHEAPNGDNGNPVISRTFGVAYAHDLHFR